MKFKFKSFAPYLLTALIFSSFSGVANAQSTSQKISEMKKKISGADKQYSNALQQKQYYDKKIEALAGDIYNADKIINSLESEIEEQNKKIEETSVKLENKQESYNTRLRALQHRGSLSYIDVIFGAESFSDFLLRVSLVNDLVTHDKNEINEIAALKREITDAKAAVEVKLEDNKNAKALIVAQKDKMKQMSDKQEAAMKSFMADKAAYKSELEKAEKAKAEEDRKAAAIAAQAAASARAASSAQTVRSANASGFMYPLPGGGRVSCSFGYRTDPFPSNHTGVDLAIASGSPIVASKGGTVASVVKSNTGYGNCIIINHGDGTSTRYAHCSKMYVSNGQKVSQGETIAAVGSTGLSTGPHLHFEIYINGARVNPMPYIR